MSDQANFSQNYQTLQTIANRLSNAGEVDIDELIPMVDEASKAYQVCKSRLDAVEEALNQRLETTEQTTGQNLSNNQYPGDSNVPF